MGKHLYTVTRLAIAVIVVGLGVSTAGAQETLQTPWGDPDLQGVWDYWTFTPLERPEEFAGRDSLTAEEAAQVAAAGRAAALQRDREAPPEGNPGGYGQEVWTERGRATALNQPSLIVDPADGRLPVVTTAEETRVDAHSASGGRPVRTRASGIGSDAPTDRGLAERCLVGFSTGPPFLPGGYNNNVQIFQSPGWVALAVEMVHDFRFIPVDGREHPPDELAQWLGVSRGHWDGDTLVVETRNFTDRVGSFSTTSEAWGTGEGLTLIERFTRTDHDTLQYEFTVDNPEVFTTTFSGSYPMNRSDLPLYEYACHEGNYGLFNILTGARAEELATAGSRD